MNKKKRNQTSSILTTQIFTHVWTVNLWIASEFLALLYSTSLVIQSKHEKKVTLSKVLHESSYYIVRKKILQLSKATENLPSFQLSLPLFYVSKF